MIKPNMPSDVPSLFLH